MPRKLVLVNVLLLALGALSVVYIGRQMMAPMPMPQAGRARPAATVTERAETPRAAGGAYQVVSARNLFSPTRTEAPVSPAATAMSAAVKPNLHGIVLREGAPIAYLEDPTTKRTAGYRVGDAIGGGTVQAIKADGVVIARPDGNMDVRLRDPSKPRAAAAPVAQPGQPGVVPGAAPGAVQGTSPAIGLPGVIPPQTQPGPVPPQPGVAQPQPPGVVQPPAVTPPQVFPGRRPLPPNLLRRIPPGQPSDAPQQ